MILQSAVCHSGGFLTSATSGYDEEAQTCSAETLFELVKPENAHLLREVQEEAGKRLGRHPLQASHGTRTMKDETLLTFLVFPGEITG